MAEESFSGVIQRLEVTNSEIIQVKDESNLTNEFLDMTVDVFRDKFNELIGFIQGDSLEQLEEQRETARKQAALTNLMSEVNEKLEEGIDQRKEIIDNQEKEEEGFGLGGLALGIALTLGTFKGVVQGYIASTKALLVAFKNLSGAILKPIRNLFSSVVKLLRSRFGVIDDIFKGFQGIGRGIVETFRNFGARVKTIMSVAGAIGRASLMAPINAFFSAVRRFQGIFSTAGGALSKVGATIAKSFSAVTQLFRSAVSTLIKPIKATASATGRIGKLFGSVTGVLARMGTAIATAARFAGPIGVLINIAIGAFGTITGAIKGFKEGGIVGALQGAITGFFKALVGVPLDMIKGAVAFVLDMFGLDRVAEALRSFSFSDIIESIVAAPFKIFEFIKDWIVDKVKGLGSIVASLIPGPIKKLLGIDGSEQEEEGPRTREDVQSELAEAREDKEGRFGFGAEGRREEDQERIDALERELAMLDNAEGPNAVELEKMERDRKRRQTERARQEAGYTVPDQQESDVEPRGRGRRDRRPEVGLPEVPGESLQSSQELAMARQEQDALGTNGRGSGGGVGMSVADNSTTNMISQPTINNNPLPNPSRRPDTARDLYYRNPFRNDF